MTIAIAVPGDGPLFEGHFPGRPILPGVTQLVLVVDAIRAERDEGPVRALRSLRLRALVEPGDALALDVRRPERGLVRFDLRREGAVVADGFLELGPPDHGEEAPTSVAALRPRGIPPLDHLIPHRPPMRFVESVLGEAEDGITCLARIPSACPLVTRGIAPAVVALEAAAQAAAVWEALRRTRDDPDEGGARVGYLVSARDVTVHGAAIPAGGDLIATARLTAFAPPLSLYEIQVVSDGSVALRGTIGAYLVG